uniref:C2H2-type domain-containing protein n=1 Tax=Acrobeloides nanus TaxID=290746 RepID=A0A914DB97_9BILA
MEIKQWSFSESQSGKSSCDRLAAVVKRRVYTYLDSNHDVSTPHQLFHAITDHIAAEPLRGMSVYYTKNSCRGTSQPCSSKKRKTESSTIIGISGFYEFVIEENGLRAFKHAGIGIGKLFSWPLETIETMPLELSIFNHGGQVAVTPLGQSKESEKEYLRLNQENMGFWRYYKPTKPTLHQHENHPHSDTNEDEDDNPSFECSEDTCDASFDTYEALVEHFMSEHHHKTPQKTTLHDYAIKTYKSELEEIDRQRILLPEVREELQSNIETDSDPTSMEPMGWALQGKRTVTRFSEKVRNFLKQKFLEGETTGIKYDGNKLAPLMRSLRDNNGNPMFSVNELLTQQQIDSTFSRISRQRKEESRSTMPEQTKNAEGQIETPLSMPLSIKVPDFPSDQTMTNELEPEALKGR